MLRARFFACPVNLLQVSAGGAAVRAFLVSW